ncbi:unnamed protein product [Lasius platythorax]|uniref:Uncharacterized protein n=1 Tax=Lasius platythorax TaxID=488582 RepID=A0AAV2NTS6_9HYME
MMVGNNTMKWLTTEIRPNLNWFERDKQNNPGKGLMHLSHGLYRNSSSCAVPRILTVSRGFEDASRVRGVCFNI